MLRTLASFVKSSGIFFWKRVVSAEHICVFQQNSSLSWKNEWKTVLASCSMETKNNGWFNRKVDGWIGGSGGLYKSALCLIEQPTWEICIEKKQTKDGQIKMSSWWIRETGIAMDIFCCVYYRASHEGQPNTIERVTILFRQCGEQRDWIRLSQLDCVLHCVSDLIPLI